MDTVVQINNLRFKYGDEREVLKGINLSIKKGESVGIIGCNGAGKSTLLLNLVGILYPSDGEIKIKEMVLNKKNLSKIREIIGLVFQDADDQLFMPTVYEDVAFGPRSYNFSNEEIESRVKRALETVGIYNLKDRPPHKLSGGEKRAAAIATVLAMNPEIIIMDEPTSALDPKARKRFIELLKCFNHTKLITTHDLDMVIDLCDRTIIMQNGIIVADGNTKELLSNKELLERCDLEIPLRFQGCPICGKS